MSREGKLVFLERVNESKSEPDYYSGEYVVIRDTGNVLHCVKASCDGYELSQLRSFALIGVNPWKVVSEKDGSVMVSQLIANLPAFIAEGQLPVKRWCSSVYDKAADTLRHLKSLLNPAAVATVSPDGREITITIRLNA